jgi:hypothetical protein
MTSIYDEFATDADLEAHGFDYDLGDLGKFKVAAWMNERHQAVLKRLRAPYKSFELSGRDLPADKAEAIGVQAMAEAVLIGWSGVKDKQGQDLPYSVENAITLLTDLKRFRNLIVAAATEAENFKAKALEAAAGN